MAEQKKTDPVPAAAAKPAGPACPPQAGRYVAVEDFTWCGSKVKSGEPVNITNAGLARDLLSRKIIREK